MARHTLKFWHTGSVKPPRIFCLEKHDVIAASDTHSCSHDAVIRVYDDSGSVIETHQHIGDRKEWWA